MNNSVSINLVNGLGDKLLDLTGFYIICKYLNYNPIIKFDNNNHHWGKYDMRLFEFKDITFSDDSCNFYIHSPNPSSSLCPYKVYIYLKTFYPELSFEQVSNDFIEYSKNIIKPSEIIISNIPKDTEKAYGIHLRKSDKVDDNGDLTHISTSKEFEIITNKLLEDVNDIIEYESEPIFLVVSESNDWKIQISNTIKDIANKKGKKIKILDIEYRNNYDNYSSVLDMFCLSKCKEVLQGVKYSTFSILASILGNGKLRNYSKYTNTNDVCLINNWTSVIDINNKKNYDLDTHEKTTRRVRNIQTNINKVYFKESIDI